MNTDVIQITPELLVDVVQRAVRPSHLRAAASAILRSKQSAAAPARTNGLIDLIALMPGRPPLSLAQKPECRS
jgi:hypothetical protein